MKKEVKIAGVVLLALVLVVLVYYASKTRPSSQNGNSSAPAGVPADMLKTQTPDAAKATQALISEVAGDQTNVKSIVGGEVATNTNGVLAPKEIKVAVVTSGSSGIDVNSGQVVTTQGAVAVNNVSPGAPGAPQSSFAIDPKTAPASAVKLNVTMNSFSPNVFTVSRGQAVALVVTNVNETSFTEVFRFDDPSLSAIALGLAKGETKSITFNAPDKAGEYVFYSSMFDHRSLGAVGKMIVK